MSYYLKVSITFSFILFLLALVVFIFCCYKKKENSYILLLLFLSLAMIITSYNLNYSVLIKNVDKSISIEGIVDEIILQDKSTGKYIIKAKSISKDGNRKEINEKTVLKILGESDLQIGDKIKFNGIPKIPMENTNPKLYNYRKNLLSKNVYTTINIKSHSLYKYENKSEFKYRMKIYFRDTVEDTFDKYLNKNNSELMKGIVLGDYSYLDEDNLNTYREIGLSHILAVSGLHIGIIAGFILFCLSRIGVNRKWNVILTISVIWVYGYLISFPSSILRANIMFSVLFLSGLMAEPYDSINSLFFSSIIVLMFNPLSIFSVGFQLSYIATFSILFFSPKITRWFYPYKNKLVYTSSGLFGLYIGILPIQIHYFNRFSIIGIVSNIVIAPILSLGLIISGILLLTEWIFSPLSFLIGYVLNTILTFQNIIASWIYKWDFFVFKFSSPDIFEITLYYILIFIVFKSIDFKHLKKYVKSTIYVYLIILLIWNIGIIMTDASIEINFIDIGQGDSCLINTKRGAYLVDTGGNMFGDFDVGENITLPYLEKHGINRLEGVFITHFDLDHCKGLPILMENIDIKNIFVSYRDNENEIYNYILNSDIPVVLLQEGNSINLDKNTKVDVISPNFDMSRRFNANNLSLVFNLSYYDKNILFTGDIESEVEAIIANKINKKIDILKVAHHGSKTSSTSTFLDRNIPDISIISVGRNNFYGHPNEEVIKRFKELNTTIYRTDTMGMIKVDIDVDKLEVVPFLSDTQEGFLEKHSILIAFILLYYLISYILVKSYVFVEERLEKYELQ